MNAPKYTIGNQYYMPKETLKDFMWRFRDIYKIWLEDSKYPDHQITRSKALLLTGRRNRPIADPTLEAVIRKTYATENLKALDRYLNEINGPVFGKYLKMNVCDGLSYETIKKKYDISFSKSKFYRLRNQFYWKLMCHFYSSGVRVKNTLYSEYILI